MPKKISKRKFTILSWVCVAAITTALLLWLFLEGSYYDEHFHETKIADEGSIFLDLRLKKIEQLGGKTFVVSEMKVSAKRIKNPKCLSAKVRSMASKRGNTYRLTGCYDHSREYFSGKNKEIHITPKSGSTSWFPFDSLSFDMAIDIVPEADITIPYPAFRVLHLYQELEGGGYVFVNPQFIPIKKREGKGAKIQIKFRLARKLFAKIAFVVYAAFVILYVIILVRFSTKLEKLVLPLVGFFVSIWSLRQGLNSFSVGHTTLVDYFFLFVPLVLLLLILAKIVTGFHGTKD